MNRWQKPFLMWLCAVVLLGAGRVTAQDHRVVMFYPAGHAKDGQWQMPRWELFTHLIFIGTPPITNGAFVPPAGNELNLLLKLRDAGHQNGRKVMYCVPGGITAFTNMLHTPVLRTNFARGVASFIRAHRLDGVDFDIEYPYKREDGVALGEFLTVIRAELGRQPLLTADTAFWAVQIPVSVINNQLDWVQIMDYDHKTNIPSALDFARAALQKYLSAGVPASKLVLGVGLTGHSPDEPYDAAYNGLMKLINPYNETQDVVTNSSGTRVWFLNGNRATQRAKVNLAATNANGTMCWHLLADTTNATTSLAVAIHNQRTRFVAPMDGFEYAPGTRLDSLYTPTASCQLAITNERVAGDAAVMATIAYSGDQGSGGGFSGPIQSNGWSFPANAFIRFDMNPVQPVTNATFCFTLFDGVGNTADCRDTTVLRSSGWHRQLLQRGNFQSVSPGFNWNDIRRYSFQTQLSVANSAAHTNCLLIDNLSLLNPVVVARPARTDDRWKGAHLERGDLSPQASLAAEFPVR